MFVEEKHIGHYCTLHENHNRWSAMIVGHAGFGMWDLYVFAEMVVRRVPASDIWAMQEEVPFGIQRSVPHA